MEPITRTGARTTPLDPRYADHLARLGAPRPGVAPPQPQRAPATRTLVTVRRGARSVVTLDGNANLTAMNEMITAFEAGAELEDPARIEPASGRIRRTTRLGAEVAGEEGEDLPVLLLPGMPGYDPARVNPRLKGIASARMTPAQRKYRITTLIRSLKLMNAERSRLLVTVGRMARTLVQTKFALMSARDNLRLAIQNRLDPGRIAKLTENVRSLESAVAKIERDMADIGQQITQLGIKIDDVMGELLSLGVEV